MSLATSQNRIQSQASGSGTTFPFPYLVYVASELTVIDTDPVTGLDKTCILNSDYTVDPSQLGQPTGVTVTFILAPTAGHRITIARIVSYIQPLQLPQDAQLPSASLEKQLDETVMQVQQLADAVSRVPQLPLSAPIGSSLLFRAGDYQAYDVSSGVTPQIAFTPGNHKDSVGGSTWVPTVGGITIDTLPAPVLIVGSTATKVWFKGAINPATGAMTALEIDSGTAIPADTTTAFYQLVTNISVDISTGVAKVNVLGGGVSGSQNYFYCGITPATDGSGHLLNG